MDQKSIQDSGELVSETLKSGRRAFLRKVGGVVFAATLVDAVRTTKAFTDPTCGQSLPNGSGNQTDSACATPVLQGTGYAQDQNCGTSVYNGADAACYKTHINGYNIDSACAPSNPVADASCTAKDPNGDVHKDGHLG